MKWLALLLFVTGSSAADAQNYTALKAGGSISTLKFNIENNNRARFGWYGGITANFQAAEQFFVRTELIYSLRGYEQPASAIATKGKISYSYISVPLLGGYLPIKNLSIMAGPEIGYLLSAKAKDETNTTDVLGFVNNRFSIDANIGASYALTPELAVETHFLVGLTSLYRVLYTDSNGNLTGPARDGYNRVMQFGIIYKMSGN